MNYRPLLVTMGIGASALLATGCRGKVLGTALLNGPGSADAQFQSTGAPVVLWADTDGTWTGGWHSHFAAHYEIDVIGGTTRVGHITCDTKDSSQQDCRTSGASGNTHTGDCEIKLACDVPAIPAGPATLHVVGTLGAGTSEVKRMSVNVRGK